MNLAETLGGEAYDEFGWLEACAAEWGIEFRRPRVQRRFQEVTPGRYLSALQWGSTPPQLVLLHGGRQNAHTWDTVLLQLGRPALAIDLLSGKGGTGAFTDPAQATAELTNIPPEESVANMKSGITASLPYIWLFVTARET